MWTSYQGRADRRQALVCFREKIRSTGYTNGLIKQGIDAAKSAKSYRKAEVGVITSGLAGAPVHADVLVIMQ